MFIVYSRISKSAGFGRCMLRFGTACWGIYSVLGPAMQNTNGSTAQHSTAQHSTAQHSTAQHSTAQHSTMHLTATSSAYACMLVICCAKYSFVLGTGIKHCRDSATTAMSAVESGSGTKL